MYLHTTYKNRAQILQISGGAQATCQSVAEKIIKNMESDVDKLTMTVNELPHEAIKELRHKAKALRQKHMHK